MAIKTDAALILVLLYCGLLQSKSERVLHLLNVQPYPDNRIFAGWDKGFELIPAGHLAIKQINNRSDILPGYRLELIDIESEACGISITNTGYVNFYRHLVQPDLLVVGVVGLFCSTVTAAISPVANHPQIDYVQITASTSPLFQDVSAYPRLFHTISSSTVFNKAVVTLMAKFQWHKIGLIYNSVGVYFFSTADNFVSRVKANFSLDLFTSFSSQPQFVPELFSKVKNVGVRIIFTSLTVSEGATFMCEAYRRRLLWPSYVYIFYEQTVQEQLNSETSCDKSEMLEALEGVFLLQYKMQANPTQRLVSGLTYEEYHKAYLQHLYKFANSTDELQPNTYATVLHDQVWAFALALNKSIEDIKFLNVSIADYTFGQSKITDTIAHNLEKVSFQGASGYIRFDSNRKTETSVNIYQVQGGKAVLVAVYDPNEDNLTLTDPDFVLTVPADQFEVVYELLPHWLMISIFCICGLAYIMTTIILVLFLYWRNEPEIKATSPYLSLVMFAGCYLLYTAAVMRTAYQSFVIEFNASTAICNIDIWFRLIGINFIFSTLFMRLLRIYHVFRVFRKTSKLWSDQFLFLGVMLICSGTLIILILWTAVDISHLEETQTYISSAHPPYHRVTRACHSKNLGIWLIAVFAYNGLIILLVIFLAVQTRHVEWCNFKDTKKVNAYIFTVVAIIAIAVPLSYIFSYTQVKSELGGHIISVVAYLSIAVLGQVFLFASKILPLFSTKVCNHFSCECNYCQIYFVMLLFSGRSLTPVPF